MDWLLNNNQQMFTVDIWYDTRYDGTDVKTDADCLSILLSTWIVARITPYPGYLLQVDIDSGTGIGLLVFYYFHFVRIK